MGVFSGIKNAIFGREEAAADPRVAAAWAADAARPGAQLQPTAEDVDVDVDEKGRGLF